MSLVKRPSWKIQLAVWHALFIRELKTKVGEHKAGPLWLFIEPLIQVAFLVLIFTYIRERNDFQGIPFAAFFAAGVVPFMIFQNTLGKSVSSIRHNKQLLSYKQVQLADPIFIIGFTEFFVRSITLIILIFIGFWFFHIDSIPHHPIEVTFILILILLFSFGIGFIFAVIGAKSEEIGGLLVMPVRILYFLSGIIIPIQELPESLHKYILWNPLAHGIEQIRANTFDYYDAGNTSIIYLFLCTIASLSIGFLVFRSNRSNILILR